MPPGFLAKLGFAEAIFGLIFACFLALSIIVGGIIAILQLAIYDRNPPPPFVIGLLGIAWFLACVFQVRSIWRYTDGFENPTHPLPVHIAVRQPIRPMIVRPFVGTWWLINAATLLVMAHALAQSYPLINPSMLERVIQIASQVFILFSGAVASNTYLLLAVHSIVPSRRPVQAAWRFRILIDLGLVLASFVVDDFSLG